MTVGTENNRNDYVGTGAVSVYAYSFRILAEEDITVTQRDTLDVETTLTLNVDYTVDGVGIATGGNITLLAGNLASGYALTIRRTRAFTQLTDIRNQGAFYPEVIEDALDDITMKAQTLKEQVDRAVILPETSTASNILPQPSALKILRWNATASALEAVDVGDLPTGVTTYSGGLELTGADLHVKDLGIVTGKIAAGAVTSAKLDTNIDTAGYIAAGTDLYVDHATPSTQTQIKGNGTAARIVDLPNADLLFSSASGKKITHDHTAYTAARVVTWADKAINVADVNELGNDGGIVNGTFTSWQEGTSFTSTSPEYVADTFWKIDAGANTASRLQYHYGGIADGLFNWVRHTRTAGDTDTSIRYVKQAFTTAQTRRYVGKTITFSFFHVGTGSTTAPTISGRIYYGTGTDQAITAAWTGGTVLATKTDNITTAVTRTSVTATIPDTATQLQVFIYWTPSGTAPGNDLVQHSGWQIDEGDRALPLRHPTTLMYDTRSTSWQSAQTLAALTILGGVANALRFDGYDGVGGTSIATTVRFPVPMQKAPSISVAGTWNMTNMNGTAPLITPVDNGSCLLYQTGTAAGFTRCYTNSADDLLIVDSRL